MHTTTHEIVNKLIYFERNFKMFITTVYTGKRQIFLTIDSPLNATNYFYTECQEK